MTLWGRNDQPVTANSITTKESSNGAPIGTYTAVKGDQVNRTGPANAHFGNTSPSSRALTDVDMFNNTTPGAFIPNQAVGVFGVSATEESNNILNHSLEHPAHAGWNIRRAGTGPIVSINFSHTTSAYNNADIITISSPQAGGNSTVRMSTNSTGGAVSLTIANPGAGFLSPTIPVANIFITNSSGGSATGNSTVTYLVAKAGGRAGRVHYETLVAMGSLGAEGAAYGTPANVSDASSDNIEFPGV